MPQALVGAGGFVAGMLWMHLMFDFLVLGHAGTLPAETLATLSAHYRQVMDAADPMGNVVYLVMILAVLGTVLQLSRGAIPRWLRAAALVTAAVPLFYTLTVVDPAATRLGAGATLAAQQSELARTVLLGHSVCLFFVAAFMAAQVAAAQRSRSSADIRRHSH